MVKIRKIAETLFKKSSKKDERKGLVASLEDLMEQRKNVRYLHIKTRLNSSVQAGDVKSAFKGRGIELEESREYAFGDDVRDIDWRITARKNTPYTKIYNEEKDREIYVLLDLSSSMVFGTRKELKSVTASKITALLGWMAQENNDRFGALIFDGQNTWQFKPQQNRAHLLAIFKKISLVNQHITEEKIQNKGLNKTLQMMVQGIKSRATVFVVSDFSGLNDDDKKSLAMLAKKCQLFCVNVYDMLEEKAPLPGEYMISDEVQSVVFDSRYQAFCEEYQRFFADKREKMREFCRKFGCRYLSIRTDIAITKQMKII